MSEADVEDGEEMGEGSEGGALRVGDKCNLLLILDNIRDSKLGDLDGDDVMGKLRSGRKVGNLHCNQSKQAQSLCSPSPPLLRYLRSLFLFFPFLTTKQRRLCPPYPRLSIPSAVCTRPSRHLNGSYCGSVHVSSLDPASSFTGGPSSVPYARERVHLRWQKGIISISGNSLYGICAKGVGDTALESTGDVIADGAGVPNGVGEGTSSGLAVVPSPYELK